MDSLNWLGRSLIILGLFLVLAGIVISFAGKIPFLGKLPGDIYVQKKNFTFYFPVTTAVVLSILLSLLMWLFFRR